MTLIIEDGTGVAGAETYHTRAFFDTFVTDWGLGDPTTVLDAVYEPAARRGALVFDSVYAHRFPGYPVSGTQGLMFPMLSLVDVRSYAVPPLPIQVKRAAAALTWYETQSSMSLLPNVTPNKSKKLVTAGPVTVEFDLTAGGYGLVAGARPIIAIVESLLRPLGGSAMGAQAHYGSVARG